MNRELQLVADALATLDPRFSSAAWQRRAFEAVGADARDPELESRMVSYLEGRYETARGRAAIRANLASARARGIERFAPGLDASLDVVREQRAAKGGLDEADEIELGRRPRGER